MLKVGDKVPEITLPSSTGKDISFKDFNGKKIVLYFYPRDETPGCTKEACGFRDLSKDFEEANTVILGVSKDSLKSHEKFKEKHSLPFPLLSDENLELMEKFGVWKEKSMYGRTFLGVERSTFLIDKNGIIQKEWRKVKVVGHMDEVLKAAKDL